MSQLGLSPWACRHGSSGVAVAQAWCSSVRLGMLRGMFTLFYVRRDRQNSAACRQIRASDEKESRRFSAEKGREPAEPTRACRLGRGLSRPVCVVQGCCGAALRSIVHVCKGIRSGCTAIMQAALLVRDRTGKPASALGLAPQGPCNDISSPGCIHSHHAWGPATRRSTHKRTTDSVSSSAIARSRLVCQRARCFGLVLLAWQPKPPPLSVLRPYEIRIPVLATRLSLTCRAPPFASGQGPSCPSATPTSRPS